jgi:hypothetical protein
MAISWFAPRCFRYNPKMDCTRIASSSLITCGLGSPLFRPTSLLIFMGTETAVGIRIQRLYANLPSS